KMKKVKTVQTTKNKKESTSEAIKIGNKHIDMDNILKSIFISAPTGILTVDYNGKIEVANPALEKMFGYEPGELIGKDLTNLIPERFVNNHFEAFNHYIKNPRYTRLGIGRELFGKTKSGGEIPLEIGLAPLAFPFESIIATVIDISYRKSIDEFIRRESDKIKTVLELNTDGWWEWNLKDKNIKYMSSGFKKLLGYSDDEIPNTNEAWKKLVYEEDLQCAQKIQEQHYTKYESDPYYQIVRYNHKNGSIISVICKGVGIKNELGEIDRMIGVHIDITKQVELENELKKSNQILLQKNLDMEQLVYTISHDLKSPLITSMSFIDFLKEDFEAKKYQDVPSSIEQLKKSINRIKELIEAILEYNRAGSLGLNFSKINTQILISDIIERFKGSKGGRLKFEILGDLPIVTGDKDKLKRVFENLIVNSINHKGDKNVHILIFGKSDDQYNTICIKDNGPGIDKKYHDKIFEPFKSLDKKSGGSGIGLSIVKKIVDLHNGKIELKSSIGEGAEFCISIPNN
ncbi:MAG: PAS domain-containing sensor histidine kinase, partial [Bdellovibrionales bacterium]|nr:PAS domain-containing sensor histidine kinase [Bdellovibrionales bacterium]